MSGKSDILKALRDSLKNQGEQYCVVCTVDSVNMTDKTCELTPINGGADLQNVRLIANNDIGFLIKPKIGSVVVASFLNDAVAYVSMFSQVDEIQLNGDNYNGLVKIDDLKTQLNTLQAAINTLKTLTGTAISVYSAVIDGGVSASTFNAAVLAQVNLTTLENITVSHGNGI